jgi:23S rRNA (cytosine1962-C5)-methyltransferase
MKLLEINENFDHPLLNRIVKNYKHLRKQAKKKTTDCFRIYDRDIPEFRLAVDYYAGRFLIQYYSGPEDEELPSGMKSAIEEGLIRTFGIQNEQIYWKVRKKRDLLEQYEKISDTKEFFSGTENGAEFLINLKDYLDSGLFLDHRPAREYSAGLAKGKNVLNLYSYTASFSVYCAKAGSAATLSVDMSNTYTLWADRNFELNGLSKDLNRTLREDCFKYLRTAEEGEERFDLIIIDPPTISRSKKMEEMFDINTDHPELIIMASKLLKGRESIILFSTNSRKFRMDENLQESFEISDISSKMMPDGFRDKKIHKVFIIKLK